MFTLEEKIIPLLLPRYIIMHWPRYLTMHITIH